MKESQKDEGKKGNGEGETVKPPLSVSFLILLPVAV